MKIMIILVLSTKENIMNLLDQFTSSPAVQETALGQLCHRHFNIPELSLLLCQFSATDNKLIRYVSTKHNENLLVSNLLVVEVHICKVYHIWIVKKIVKSLG